MEKKKKSERDKYREIFAQIFKTSPEQDEIEELSKPANRVDQNLVDQNLVDQKMVYQKLVDQNLVDQNLDYSQVVDAIILRAKAALLLVCTNFWVDQNLVDQKLVDQILVDH